MHDLLTDPALLTILSKETHANYFLMKRIRLVIEFFLLVAVIALLFVLWQDKADRDKERFETDTHPEQETPSKIQISIVEQTAARETAQARRPQTTPNRNVPRIPQASTDPRALRENEVEAIPPATLVIRIVDEQGFPQTRPAQVYSTDCGFTLELQNGSGTAEVGPGRCSVQAQAQDGALIVRSPSVIVELRSGVSTTIDLMLPAPSIASPGVSVFAEENYLVVQSVDAGSPAASINLQPGDIIMAIDGVMVEGQTPEQIEAMLFGPANSAIQFTLVVQNDAGDFEELTVQTSRQRISTP